MATKQTSKTREVWEFGDFQTPWSLAREVSHHLAEMKVAPQYVLEPTCGKGTFIRAVAEAFPEAHIIGVEINPEHLNAARNLLSAEIALGKVALHKGDFFNYDWSRIFNEGDGPWLIVGNPPWVTSAELGSLGSTNLPMKSNFQNQRGIDSIMGKSNFDISEVMLLRYLDWLKDRHGWIAVLVKTAVARKVLVHAWKQGCPLRSASVHCINAAEHFGASVDACLLILTIEPGASSATCETYNTISAHSPVQTWGYLDNSLVAKVDRYMEWRHLAGQSEHYEWRSGIKHDCSRIMEFTAVGDRFRNGIGEEVELEEAYIFPMLKSSDINKVHNRRNLFMLVPQKRPGEETAHIQITAPLTWTYLQRHAATLALRRSSIYRNKPPFSVFGVGGYSFSRWKVVISGFYKSLQFVPVGPLGDRPIVLDDTVYAISCQTREEMLFLTGMLNSAPAQGFYDSMIFWSDKRPITVDLLKRLDLSMLASELGLGSEYEYFVRSRNKDQQRLGQLRLL